MLHIHRAERSDRLVVALAEVVAEPFDDPLVPEIVAVPTRGVERWLTQRLSHTLGVSAGRADGVCANVDFPFPGQLVGDAVRAATSAGRAATAMEADPWLPDRALWPLLDVVAERVGEPWLATLGAHLGGADDTDRLRRDRRLGAVRHLADAFDRYGVHRPGMVRAWAAGADTAADGTPLPADVAWQARLWRCLRERIGSPSPAERLEAACDELRRAPELSDLPSRISLYGLTRLPASHLDVLLALGAHRSVHLFLLHPSPALWDKVSAAELPRRDLRRRDDPTARLPRNPLLATWGQDAREVQLVLLAGGAPLDDDHRPHDIQPRTLLEHVQAAVRADQAPTGAPLPGHADTRPALAPDDRSLQVHSCHGRARQVEVIRDAILHLLADDPTLEPRDIIVMCPDIEAFAPLVHATFGAGDALEDEEHPTRGDRPPDLRVRLADRALRQTNPVLGAVSQLLALATGRATASQVLDLAGREPVRRRFSLDDDDLARIEDWVAATGIRWGLDAEHRAPYKLDGFDDGTWRSGLDRILLGVAVAEDTHRLVGGVLPLDDVGSRDIELAGRLAELVDRLHVALVALSAEQPVAGWAAAIAAAADALTATSQRDAWQRAQLQRILDDVVTGAQHDDAPSVAVLTPAEMRDLLAERLGGRPTRASFRTGHLTVCTLVPMRSVPHRVVCLLGLDDGVFPRRFPPDGDDLVARDPHVGDRDPRSEDRQLLLDALLAAQTHLVVTYSGRDERTNAALPPAVPIGELLDVVDATVRVEGAKDSSAVPARERVVVKHPLQPFDVRNFTPGQLVGGRAWSFDTAALHGAQALVGRRHDPPAFLPGSLPPVGADVIELDALVRFVQHPARTFLRERLGIRITQDADDPADALPVELDKLEEWGLGQRLLDARLAGADPAACRAAELARGTLPPGSLAAPVIDRVGPLVDAIAAAADGLTRGARAREGDSHNSRLWLSRSDGHGTLVPSDDEPASVEIDLPLADGRALVGTAPGVHGDLLRAVTYSRVAAKHRLAAWVRLLALSAAHPERAFEAATVGRSPRSGSDVTISTLPALGEDGAARHATAMANLAVLLDIFDRGMREPVPLFCKTSAAFAEAVMAGRDPEAAMRREWETTWDFPREDLEAEHQLVLGGVRTLAELLAEPLRDDERGPGWDGGGPTRVGRYARRLWAGLLEREAVTDR
ncbi:MAG: exodeoxyribonuclease V subunit gamma [Euzebyales bacterium]|nr:exodeoxyribonuclease V subunit gamma [Euzebyales bacterium]